MTLRSTDPATGETIAEYEAHGDTEVQRALDGTESAFRKWRTSSVNARATALRAVAEALTRRRDELAELASREMGKRISESRAEVEKCAWVCQHYADTAAQLLADRKVDTDKGDSRIAFQPLGAILAIMPWNFPYWQVFRFAAPTLIAGNVVMLKHASNVPGCALAIEDVFKEAGLPDGAFRTLLIDSKRAGRLIEDDRIAAVTLTGSDVAGRKVGEAAGRSLKKAVLELGGSDPFIVLPSADFDEAVATAVKGRMQNNGQSCIAAKRFIVHTDIYDRFIDAFGKRFDGLHMGHQLDAATDLGPLATPSIRDDLARQVDQSIAAGAHRLCGGRVPEGQGNFYPPTILTDAPAGSPAATQELFGPVATVFRAETLDHAIDIANRTVYGLGASAWTTQPDEAERLLRDLTAGSVFVNQMVASDPRLPFGGVKQSGYGRELGSFGIHEFVNIKTLAAA